MRAGFVADWEAGPPHCRRRWAFTRLPGGGVAVGDEAGGWKRRR